nr:enolase C-terminal domain-like protein [Fundidesulfovibrio agrisoli]
MEWGVARVPLAAPYQLSFVTLTRYDTVWVRCEDTSGSVGLGEAVALPGYGWETQEDILETVAALCAGAEGLTFRELADRCRKSWPLSPFAASAVMTAMEFPGLLGSAPQADGFALNWPVAGDAHEAALRGQVLAGLERGYGFIKVKVGKNPADELSNLPLLLAGLPGDSFRVLFDANQGYSFDQALDFSRGLGKNDSGRLLWFEQPLHRDDWDGLARLCALSPVPVILDESVYSEEHVRRAAAMGAHGVKLKLFKQCGPAHCLELARLAVSLGLTVVFGNGVATDVGNLAEYLLLAAGGGLFSAPAESNGFRKLASPLLGGVVAERGGSIRLEVGKGEVARRIQAFNPEYL